ncbi:D-alanyl-D-alanine carboxypeptidase family protein [Desulfonatronum thioautotrophicum]|uniref:D-alanyl-D-alanine carboxypeptidase family protein n=1 Tax=Desulfonatronum thioautotrophicum TaxID=617001 RepID=UPI0005EAE802|nr:D-alanyl-D-alanine carboxypeptidase family protein [Desulfonatronum thioautotrophicum]
MLRRNQLPFALHRLLRNILAAMLLLICTQWVALAAPPREFVPSAAGKAAAYLLLDATSGRILAAHNIDAPRQPASLTKMMTVYVAGQKLNAGTLFLTDQVRVSERAWRMSGSRMFLELHSSVPVAAVLHGIIIQSGNDASVALAEHIAGTEADFVSLMNQTAQELGMTRTTFANATGLPAPGVQTTARDMATLSLALLRDHPYLYSLHAIRHFEHNNISQTNRNRLLHSDPTVDGIKTGYTRAAGYCQTTSAVRDEMRLITVVLGADTVPARTRLNQELLEYGFRHYETHRLHVRGEPLGAIRVWKARQSELPYGLDTDILVTIPRGRLPDLDRRLTLSLAEPVLGPMFRGRQVGTLEISLDGETLAQEKLLTLSSAEPAGFFSAMVDTVRLFLLRTSLF